MIIESGKYTPVFFMNSFRTCFLHKETNQIEVNRPFLDIEGKIYMVNDITKDIIETTESKFFKINLSDPDPLIQQIKTSIGELNTIVLQVVESLLNKDLNGSNNLEKDTLEEDTLEEDTLEEDTLEEDTLEEDTLKEDTLEEDTLEEDTLEEDTLEEDTLKEDTLEEDTLKEDTLEEDILEEDTLEEDIL